MFAHKKLSVWQESMMLVVDLYHYTSTFPKTEIFSLTSQIRRSAISVPANISEGAARGKPKEFIRFLRISFGSLSELETHLDLAHRLQYLDYDTFLELQIKMKRIASQISGLIRSVERKSKGSCDKSRTV
jgi:four helix bundle protein